MAIKGLKTYKQAQKDKFQAKRATAAPKAKQQKKDMATIPVKAVEIQKTAIDDLGQLIVASKNSIEYQTVKISNGDAARNKMPEYLVAAVETTASIDSGYISEDELFSPETSQQTLIKSVPGEHKVAPFVQDPLVRLARSFQDPAIVASKIKASPSPGINDAVIILCKPKADNSPGPTDPAIISFTFQATFEADITPNHAQESARKLELNEGSLKLKAMLGLITADTATPSRSRTSSSFASTKSFTPSTPHTIFSSPDDSEYLQPIIDGKGYYDRTGYWIPMYAPGTTITLQQQPLLWCQACNQYGCVKDELLD